MKTKSTAANERFGARAAVPTRKMLCEIEVCRPHESLLEAAPASSRRHVPDEGHWVLKPQNAVLWQREFFGWLDRWLK